MKHASIFQTFCDFNINLVWSIKNVGQCTDLNELFGLSQYWETEVNRYRRIVNESRPNFQGYQFPIGLEFLGVLFYVTVHNDFLFQARILSSRIDNLWSEGNR
jgi:hypothetical protein